MSSPTQETETPVELMTGKKLLDQIDYMLGVEANGEKFELESTRELIDTATYPEIVETVRDLSILALLLAHRVRELEADK